MKANFLALHRALPDNHPVARIRYLFFGHPLRNSSRGRERLGFLLGLPILAVDALSSVAYATEEILLALSVGGVGLFHFSLPVAFAITFLLAILITSYRQTVEAYPDGGGAYIVARDHLGTQASLIAASSLLIDYVLTVAVSVTAGVRALTSAYPWLLDIKVTLCVTGILGLTWINLRGLRESARFVAIPVYAFIVIILWLGAQGVLTMPAALPAPSPVVDVILDLATFAIILRAFAGGCTAMTGVEAIANAGSMLAQPHATIAKRILLALGLILGASFFALTLSVEGFGLHPLPQESLLSQFTRLLWGGGLIHEGVQLLTALILFLAANTAFAGAPKLAAILAKDGWLPKQLAAMGDRLVFSQGIVWLAFLAIILIVLFQGDTHALIPLYAIGVFTAFTFSQAGMVRYWWNHNVRSHGLHHPKFKAIVNGVGALATGLALLITFEAKFLEGAFLIFLTVPLIVISCRWIHDHYQFVEAQLCCPTADTQQVTAFSEHAGRTVIIPISRLHRGALEAIRFARQMSKRVQVVIVDIDHHNAHEAHDAVVALNWDLDVIVLSSPYRSVIRPIIEHVHQVDSAQKELAILVLPELVPAHWWQNFLHNRTANSISKALSWSEELENQARIIIHVPYYLEGAGGDA